MWLRYVYRMWLRYEVTVCIIYQIKFEFFPLNYRIKYKLLKSKIFKTQIKNHHKNGKNLSRYINSNCRIYILAFN